MPLQEPTPASGVYRNAIGMGGLRRTFRCCCKQMRPFLTDVVWTASHGDVIAGSPVPAWQLDRSAGLFRAAAGIIAPGRANHKTVDLPDWAMTLSHYVNVIIGHNDGMNVPEADL